MDTFLNRDEKRALVGFLSIYTLSALILMFIIAILYYNKGITAIEDQCSIEMSNASLMAEKELMQAQMDKKRYLFNPPGKSMRLGLFDSKGKEIYSNLEDTNVLFSKKSYKNNKHEYHIRKLDNPILGVSYIVVENDGNKNEKIKLITIIVSTIVASAFFVLLIGYLLSKILLKPIRERIEKLNRFIRDSSHEINTPISALMMSVSSIKNPKEISPRVLNHISVSAKLISQIYNTLSFVAFNEIDEIYDEEFDLKDLVEQSVRFFDEIAKSKGNSIKCSLQSTPVFLDKTRMNKVVNNLISNALKYSYPKTAIEIVLKEHTLCIINRGDGINKDDQEAIFKRFERRNRDQGGFGIGLDIVKSVCDEYNIQIKVESIPNEKTTFFLTFPKR